MLERKELLPALPNDATLAHRQIQGFAEEVMGALQLHQCLIPSCGKGPSEKHGCRFAMPRASGPAPSSTAQKHFGLCRQEDGHVKLEEVPEDVPSSSVVL